MTKQQFFKALAEYPGVTVDAESENADNLQIDAPRGKVFADNGCHTIVVPFRNAGGQSWKSDAYAEVIERLRHGLDQCESQDCDVCEL